MRVPFLTMALCAHCLAPVATSNAQEYPNYEWKFVDDPGKAGWNVSSLAKLRGFLITNTGVTACMIIRNEKVIFSFGDVQENSLIASCRKSVLSILYGKHVKSGEINLDRSLKDLGVDDIGGLLSIEKEATVRDIISARSGVFHPASFPGDNLDEAPRRGSVKPGSYWLYSNWDFNLAGYIFEKETGKDIYDEVEHVLAGPLHMQDWDRSLQIKDGDATKSVFQAYPLFLSARDMARIGQLMLNNGRWGTAQIIDESWIHEMLTARTQCTEINAHISDFRNTDYRFGYGYMWWIWQNTDDPRFNGSYMALGNMGQCIAVFPAVNVVIVYKTKPIYERETLFSARFKILSLAIESLK